MRVSVTRFLSVALLYLMTHLHLQGCSSAQQEDEDLEGEQSNEQSNNSEGGSEEQGNATANAEDGNLGEGQEVASEEKPQNAAQGEQAGSDLEEIIAGQNAEAAPAETAEAAPVEEEQKVVDAQAAPTEAAPAVAAAEAAPAVAPTTGGPGLPEMNSKMPYIVRVGESLSKIAQKIYGSSDMATEMAQLSSVSNPNFIKPGDVVYYQLTEKTMAFATAYEKAGRVEYKIQRGDTLAAIAQKVYGNQGDWKVIWRQNGNLDNPDQLEVGQTLIYLAPEALGAALNLAKSIKIADLIKVNYEKSAPQSTTNHVQPQPSQDDTTNNEFSAAEGLTGFDLAMNLFSTISTTGLGIAG